MARAQVVIESRRPDAAAALASALFRAGMDPLLCKGPLRTEGGCPLLDGARCALLDRADAVVYDLELDRAVDRVVLKSLVVEHRGMPVITERSTEERRRHGEHLTGCTVVVPFSPEHTAEAVVGALVDASGPVLA